MAVRMSACRRDPDTRTSVRERRISGVVLTAVTTWAVLAALTTVVVAAIGRSALWEDRALGFLPDACCEAEPSGSPDEPPRRPLRAV